MTTPATPSLDILENALLDPRLSYKAKGLFAALCYRQAAGLPLNQSALVEANTEGRIALSSGMRELQEHGYVLSTPTRSGGQYSGRDLRLETSPGQPDTGRRNKEPESEQS